MQIVLEQITCFRTKRNGPAVKAPRESPVYLSCRVFLARRRKPEGNLMNTGPKSSPQKAEPSQEPDPGPARCWASVPNTLHRQINKHILHKLNPICVRAAELFIGFVFLCHSVLRFQRLRDDFCVFCVLCSTIKRQILLFIADQVYLDAATHGNDDEP